MTLTVNNQVLFKLILEARKLQKVQVETQHYNDVRIKLSGTTGSTSETPKSHYCTQPTPHKAPFTMLKACHSVQQP